MGPDKSVVQSLSIRLAGKQPPPPTNGGHKVIVRTSNGDEVLTPGSMTQSVPVLTGSQTITSSNLLQRIPQAQPSSLISQNMNQSVSNTVAGRHVINIPRTPSDVNLSGNRNLGPIASVSSRVLNTDSSFGQNVIRRPYTSSPVTTQGLHYSQSVPSHLSNVSHIPPVVKDEKRNTPSPVHIISQPSLSRLKMESGLHSVTIPNGYNPLNSMSSMDAMQKSVNNLPINNLTNRDVSRMWSNQDIKLKSITSNMVSLQLPFILHCMFPLGASICSMNQHMTFT